MADIYICTLQTTLKECEFRGNVGTCLYTKTGCAFREKESNSPETYTKLIKWYEKYTKR